MMNPDNKDRRALRSDCDLTESKRSPVSASSADEAAICQARGTPIPFWVGLISVVSALLLAAGAVLSKTVPSLLTHGEPMTAGARVFADYLFARNLSLAMMFLLLLFTGHRRLLAGLMVLTALVQAFDIINLLARREFVLMPGLMLYLGALLLGASKLLGCRVWRARAWQEPSSEVNYTN